MDPPPARLRKQDLVRRRDLPWGKDRKPDFPRPGRRRRHGSFLLRDFRRDSHFGLFLAWNHDLRSARQPAQVEDTSLPYRFPLPLVSRHGRRRKLGKLWAGPNPQSRYEPAGLATLLFQAPLEFLPPAHVIPHLLFDRFRNRFSFDDHSRKHLRLSWDHVGESPYYP